MATFQQVKQQTLQLFEAADTLAGSLEKEELRAQLKTAAEHLSQGKLYVVVCGEFKQGKSSLVNALLEEPGLFPVDIDVATNLVSTITYGAKEKVAVLVGEPGKEEAREIARAEIPDYVTEQKNPGNARRARMLVVESPNARLRDGLVLVDTPGVGTLNVEHTDITYAFLPNADAVLFVSDALKPLTAEELRFVSDRVARHCTSVIFVVTKIDKNGDYATIVENNRQKLAEALLRPSDQIPILPVSSALKLSYLKSKDPEDLEESNFEAFERTLWKLLQEHRGQILVSKALVDLGRGLAELQGPIEAEWEALQQRTKEEIDALEGQFNDARDRLQTLLDNDASWRTQLTRGLTQTRQYILGQFQDGFVQVRRRATELVEDEKLLQNPKQLVGMVEVEINALMTDLSREIGEQADELHTRIEALTGLDMNPFEVGQISTGSATARESATAKKDNWWQNTLTVGSKGAILGGAGGFLGGAIGAVAGGVVGGAVGLVLTPVLGPIGLAGFVVGGKLGLSIGGVLGSLAGSATGVKQGVDQLKVRNKPEISRMLMQFVDDSQRLCSKGLNESVASLEYAMQDDFVGQLKRQKKVFEETLKNIKEARKLSQDEAAKRAATLKPQLAQLAGMRKTLEQIASVVAPPTITVASGPKRPAVAPPPVAAPPPAAAPPRAKASSDTGDWADD